MLNFSDFSIQPLINFFQLYPYSSGIFTFLIVFMETMAVIGAVLPGIVIMPAIGFLIGSDVIPFSSTLLCAVTGAITGDYVSYFLGIYFQDRIHRMWPFTKWPNLLTQGEKFFRAHGGKSVFIGRFVMVVRTVIPLIAGMLKMSLARFSFAAIPSASLWAIGYITPGILLGALSLELPPKVAAEFTFYALLIAIVIWLAAWLIKHFFKQICKSIDYFIIKLWWYCKKNSTTSWITRILADPKKPDNHQQLTLLLAAIFIFVLFFFTLYQVLTHGFLTCLDKPIYYLLSSLRTKNLDDLVVIITMMGESQVLAIASLLFFIWLLLKQYWHVAIHWLGIVMLSVAAVFSLKFFVYLPRPGEILYEKYASTFPSAHTALSLAFYGFLSVIIARELANKIRHVPYIVSGVLVLLIALSRLYLGAHWLTDVIGGIFVGLIAVLFTTIYYRRHLSAHKISLAAIIIFASVWIGFSIIKFKDQVALYSLIWSDKPSLYRLNRFGDATEALNIEWIGNIELIKQDLLKQGWKEHPAKIDSINIIRGFFDSKAIYHLPTFPQLYHNKPPALLLTKETDRDSIILVLQLWDNTNNLIGSVKYYRYNNIPGSKLLSLERFKDRPKFYGATDIFIKYLHGYTVKHKFYSQDKQPLEMSEFYWDGKILIIKSANT